jgi:hypothetical protein
MATSYTLYTLQPTVAPRLPAAPTQYDARFIEQYSNILRLYFNQLDNLLAAILSATGGDYLAFPYGAFHQDGTTTLSANITNNSTTPISVASTAGFPSGGGYILIGTEIIQYTSIVGNTFAGTITRGALATTQAAHTAGAQISEVQGTGSGTTIGVVKFNNTDYSNGVAINNTDLTQVVFSKPGIYNVAVSLQLLSFANSPDNVTVWFRLNGNDIPNTASIGTVPAIHGGVPGAQIMAFNIYQQFAINDYLQIGWTTDSGNSVVATYPAGLTPVHPVSPAVILTAQFVSAPPT